MRESGFGVWLATVRGGSASTGGASNELRAPGTPLDFG